MKELVKIVNIKVIVLIQMVVVQDPIAQNFIRHLKIKNVLTDLY